MTDNKKSYLLPGGKGIKVSLVGTTAQGGVKLEFTTPSGKKAVFTMPKPKGA